MRRSDVTHSRVSRSQECPYVVVWGGYDS